MENAIQLLSKVITDFSPEGTVEKLELLQVCSQIKLTRVSVIKEYHDTLLFLCAYAENKEVFDKASDEMNRLCDAVVNLTGEKKNSLDQTGIAFTSISGTYSLQLMLWLLEHFPNDITIHSFDKEGMHPKEILKHGMNEMEFELMSDEDLSKLNWLEKISGFKKKKDILHWFLQRINKMPLKPQLKEQMLEYAQLYITISPSTPQFSRSFGGVKILKRYFHSSGLLKKFNEHQLIHKKLPQEKKLNSAEKEEYLAASRIALALLNRETDPSTYGNADGLKVFELEHGLSIALYSINAQWRLPIESYIGFMMFKNGSPMAYGGAWLFGKRSLIGINIFEAFRGGESAFVFAQLLRTYKQAFGAQQFEVEPYQFGKNNPEGIKSGAFWFYHRFGFRPIDEKLFKLAENEHQKIISTKGYRTSVDVLKQFTRSDLSVNFGKDKVGIKPKQISLFITSVIATRFKGNREAAFDQSKQILKAELGLNYSKLKPDEKTGFEKLSLFVAFCLDLKKLNAQQKKDLIILIKQKGTSEFEYIKSYSKFPFERYFLKALIDFKIK